MSELEQLSQSENIGEAPWRDSGLLKIRLDSSNPGMGCLPAPKLEIKIGEHRQVDGRMNMATLFGSVICFNKFYSFETTQGSCESKLTSKL